MNISTSAISFAAVAYSLSGCASMRVTHVPPGESLNVALAQKAELIRLPVPSLVPVSAATRHIPAVEPELPGESLTERSAEAFSRGEFCLGAGKDDEAIAAFQEAVKINPAFTEAWQHLAMLYEKKGDSKKAMEAFRRSKQMA